MSTPAPDSAPFVPHAFPADLIAAQCQTAEYDRLFEDLWEATALVQCHPWWERCKEEGVKGADMVAARQALMHAEGAVPLGRGDVEAAA
ncbi:hypothetical protein ACWEL8_28570 [Streptomyces sp. NPDC004690]